MADFNKYYDNLLAPSEGGYVNDPDDKGGETYGGIARKSNPNWDGWAFIDGVKKNNGPIKRYTKFKELAPSVKAYFKKMYWDKLLADKITNQSLAELLVDFLVNGGFRLSKVQSFVGVTADGVMGNQTIAAINKANAKKLYDFVSDWRRDHFDGIVQKDPTQQKFYDGWLKRLDKFTFSETVVGGGITFLLLIGLGIWAFKPN